MRAATRRTLRFVSLMVLAWSAASVVNALLLDRPVAQMPPSLPPDLFETRNTIVRGLIAGISSGLLASWLELRVMPSFARRIPVGPMLAMRTVAYAMVAWVTVMIVVAVVAARVPDTSFVDLVTSAEFQGFARSSNFGGMLVFMILASFVINGAIQLNRVLGPGVAGQILVGRYLRPVEEERVFLFLDLTGSTRLAETLGPLRFSEFRNAFFHDLAEPVLTTGGQIAQYVGDEAVVTWPAKKGVDDANCLRCFFLLEAQIHERAAEYRQRFGEAPRFKAGVHVGPVVVSEVGDIKREISFSGDAINTTARLEGLCRHEDRTFLASKELLDRLELPDGIVTASLGERRLRGKEQGVHVVAIERATGAGSSLDPVA